MTLMVPDPFKKSLTKAGGSLQHQVAFFKSIVICCMSIRMLIELGCLRSSLTQHRFTDSHRLYRIVTRALSYQIKWPDFRTLLKQYIVACQRGGVSNKPTLGSGQRQDKYRTFDPLFTETG